MNLEVREINIHTYMQKMINRRTSGMDITLLILSEMFEIDIVVLFEEYLWKSDNIPLLDMDITLILMEGGHFVACEPNDGNRIEVQIPNCCRHMFVLSSDSSEQDFSFPSLTKKKGIGNDINFQIIFSIILNKASNFAFLSNQNTVIGYYEKSY